MMTISKPAPDRIDVVLSGLLDAQATGHALDDLIAQSEGLTHGTMLYTVKDFDMPTLGAITAEIARMPGLLSLLTRFDRCAVLSDAAWLRAAAEFEGAVIPFIAIKAFPLDDRATAEAWLAESDDDDSDEMAENYPV